MLIFIDTEFTGLGQRQPKLISLGLADETGRSFYAELPEAYYRQQCSEWVEENVLPLLWGGEHVLPVEALKERLRTWIEDLQDRAMLVTDSPDYDFELVKALLEPWPHNLSKTPLQFDVTAMGVNRQKWLEGILATYHTQDRPEHHALHDAFALREGVMAALERGWRPPRKDNSDR
ncbi:MAG: hypothetical protein AB1710_05330 [Pseudomonadota bacterium]